MKLNLFKNIEGKPSPISAISSNNSTIVLFRKDRTLDLIDSYTLNSYLSMEFDYSILSSRFVDFNTVVCGTECGRLVFFDTKTLDIVDFDLGHRPVKIATKRDLFTCKWNTFYYSTDKGDVYERGETESILLYRDSSVITSLLILDSGSLIVGCAEGKIKILENGRIGLELSLSSGSINMICLVIGGKYAAVCSEGSLSYFDIEMGLILEKIKVRDSSLNACVYVDDKIHVSGADSRIVAFSRSGDKFIKSYQVDTHYAEVKDIEVDNGRILTVGEDTLLSVVWPTSDRYLSNKVFYRSVELGTSKVSESFYINNRNSLDFYSFDMNEKNDVSKSTEEEKNPEINILEQSGRGQNVGDDNRDPTFRLSEASTDNIGYKRQPYKHKIRVCTEGRAYASSVSPNFKYISYSNMKETKVINLGLDGKIEVKKNLKLDAANRLLLTNTMIIIQNYKYEMILIDIITRQMLKKIVIDDHREVVYSVGDILVFGYSKAIYSASSVDKISNLNIDENIVGICEYDKDNFFVLATTKNTEAKKKYIAYKVSLFDYTPICIKSFESYALVSSVFCFRGTLGYVTPNAIHVFDEDMKEEKYPLGAVIYGCDGMKEGIVAIQDSWTNIRLGLAPSVFKQKFSNK